MTEAMKHMILTDVEGLDEATLEANTIKPTDSFETCLKKLVKVIGYMGEDNNRACVYFLDIYNDIPVSCRRILMLEEIYHHSEVDYPDMLQCLKKYITEDETAELKAQRISEAKEYLGGAVDADGKVLLYRGISEGRVMPDYSVCWTLSERVAENYADGGEFGAGKSFKPNSILKTFCIAQTIMTSMRFSLSPVVSKRAGMCGVKKIMRM